MADCVFQGCLLWSGVDGSACMQVSLFAKAGEKHAEEISTGNVSEDDS